jgi:energy-coupling factor transporter ATP-binding protein EcfA2
MILVEITNYESLTHTKLQIEGFTTLIGRNYLGKSSVLRAINAALTNKEGTEFISWGATFCEVHLIFPDLDILWHKEEGNNFYNINGKEYTKIGRGDPPQEILDAGFKPILVGDQKLYLNYAVQFFPLFLVNKRDSKSADVLTSVYGLDRIYKAIDLCNKEQRANSDMLRLREKDLVLVDKSLEKFKQFPDIAIILPTIKNKKKELQEKEFEILKISRWGSLLKDLAQHIKRLKPISDVSFPESTKITEDIKKYQALVQYDLNMTRLLSFLRKIKPVHAISLPENNVSDIKVIFLDYQKLIIWNNNYNKLLKETTRLEGIHKVSIPTATIDIEGIPKIKQMYEQVKQLSSEVKSIKLSVESLTSEIEKVGIELDSFDICPLCGVKRE